MKLFVVVIIMYPQTFRGPKAFVANAASELLFTICLFIFPHCLHSRYGMNLIAFCGWPNDMVIYTIFCLVTSMAVGTMPIRNGVSSSFSGFLVVLWHIFFMTHFITTILVHIFCWWRLSVLLLCLCRRYDFLLYYHVFCCFLPVMQDVFLMYGIVIWKI